MSGSDLSVRILQVSSAEENISFTAVASVPLTGDSWEPLPEGTIVALSQGNEVARISI
jgi:predicted glutamine amidotransferase